MILLPSTIDAEILEKNSGHSTPLFHQFILEERLIPAYTAKTSQYVWRLSEDELFTLDALRRWAELWIEEGRGHTHAGVVRDSKYCPMSHFMNFWQSQGRWIIFREWGEWGCFGKKGEWMSGYNPRAHSDASTRLFTYYSASNASSVWRFPSQVDPKLLE